MFLAFTVQAEKSPTLKFECKTGKGNAGETYIILLGKSTGDHDIFQRIPGNHSLTIKPLSEGQHAVYHFVFWEDFSRPLAPPEELAYPFLAQSKRPEVLSTLSWRETALQAGLVGEKNTDPWLGSVAVQFSRRGDSLEIQWLKPDTLGGLRESANAEGHSSPKKRTYRVQGRKSDYHFTLTFPDP